MLDVHPPHHAANTLRDFLIHIVTIVIGLLIAIGLEQGVEMLHERHSLRESHEAMQREYEENAQRINHETQFWRRGAAALQNNLLILRYLQQHPQTTEEQLPGRLYWGLNSMAFAHAAWDSAQQTGIVKLLPQSEAQLPEWEVARPVCLALPIVPFKRLDQGWGKHRPASRWAE